jgi:hypothetical protein
MEADHAVQRDPQHAVRFMPGNAPGACSDQATPPTALTEVAAPLATADAVAVEPLPDPFTRRAPLDPFFINQPSAMAIRSRNPGRHRHTAARDSAHRRVAFRPRMARDRPISKWLTRCTSRQSRVAPQSSTRCVSTRRSANRSQPRLPRPAARKSRLKRRRGPRSSPKPGRVACVERHGRHPTGHGVWPSVIQAAGGSPFT